MTSNYPSSYANFRKWASDIIHTIELLEFQLSNPKEVVEPKKRSKKIGGHYRETDNFKPFKETMSVKLIEVLGMTLYHVYIQIKDRELLSPPPLSRTKIIRTRTSFAIITIMLVITPESAETC